MEGSGDGTLCVSACKLVGVQADLDVVTDVLKNQFFQAQNGGEYKQRHQITVFQVCASLLEYS